MKAFLLYRDQDFDLQQPFPANEPALTQDLELNTLFNAMARGDDFLFEVAKKAVLSGSNDLDTLLYRQNILKDCLKNPALIREMYRIPITAIINKRKHWMGIYSRYPAAILSGSIQLLEMFVGLLKNLKRLADEHAHQFESEGFTRFFAMIKEELDDEYFARIQYHLKELKFPYGVLISAELGKGNEGTGYILRKPHDNNQSWIKQVFAKKPRTYSFSLHPRDDNGYRALRDIETRALNQVANAVAQSADHINSFFEMLRVELAFYIGCLNLYEQLGQMGEPVSFPLPVESYKRRHSFTGLYDVCLALTMKQKVVGNEGNADEKDLVIITGANQGGKSTFLRSLGLVQLMTQCGMFVPAESFCANLCNGLFTHYKRKEDASMESGKLDEELSRMSEIVNQLRPDAMVLFNESFAATNEREGAEIGRQITTALLEKRIKVIFVTHLYEFARGFHAQNMENALFLRAERRPDGSRTFKMLEAKPLETSYGKDLYKEIFE
ncbi:MAG TPA: hypothetical protein VI451_14210 [Anaerolineales bacterium]|nr:hypothetical protein [Anaerolineales bacterium]